MRDARLRHCPAEHRSCSTSTSDSSRVTRLSTATGSTESSGSSLGRIRSTPPRSVHSSVASSADVRTSLPTTVTQFATPDKGPRQPYRCAETYKGDRGRLVLSPARLVSVPSGVAHSTSPLSPMPSSYGWMCSHLTVRSLMRNVEHSATRAVIKRDVRTRVTRADILVKTCSKKHTEGLANNEA
jgi:hypothetical protein